MSEILEMHAIFKGRVQGVFFRATTKEIADELNLMGNVKNLADGTVEIYAQGSKSQLELFLKRLQENYPQSSVSFDFEKRDKNFTSFFIVF